MITTKTTHEAAAATMKSETILVGALRSARVTQATPKAGERADILGTCEFQAQREGGEWINVVTLMRAGQMAPDFGSAEPRVLVGSMRPDRWFEAQGVFELAMGEMGAE